MKRQTRIHLVYAFCLLALLTLAADLSRRAYRVHTCPESRCVMEYECQGCFYADYPGGGE